MVIASPPTVPKATNDGLDENGPRREAKWWHSTFHTVTAMVGAGVLGLPNAMAYLGWGPGVFMMVFAWLLTMNNMWQLIQLHEAVPGVRFDRYYDLGRHVFGPKLGAWIVLPQQLIVMVGCDIVYMVTGGECLQKFMELLPDFNSVSYISVAAAVMSLSYSTIAWVGCLTRGRIENVSYAYKKTSPADSMFRVFNALGQISVAYAGHSVALDIQATIPSTPEKPSKVPMWKGAAWAYLIDAICYFPVAFIGYWAFGQDATDNVIVALEKPSWLIAAANLMVVVHVIGSYQVYAMPVFDMLEEATVRRLKVKQGIMLRVVVRSAYVGATLFIGVTFPFFGDLLGFLGGFGFTPTTFILPCIFWLKMKKPKRFSVSWLINWTGIIVGAFVMVASTTGGMRNIIADASTYKFYS